jgi:hypothetical protein
MPDHFDQEEMIEEQEDTPRRLDQTDHASIGPESLKRSDPLMEEVSRLREMDARARGAAAERIATPATAREQLTEAARAESVASDLVAGDVRSAVDLDDAESVRREMQRRQDRAELSRLLAEQENLARMEELQTQGEFEEFLDQLQHEKNIEAAVRQDEIDRLWGQIQLRREEEQHRLRVVRLGNLKDIALLQEEIEQIRTRLVEMRARRLSIQQEQSDRVAEGATAAREVMARGSSSDRLDATMARADNVLVAAEAQLIERMEERLESLVASMDQGAQQSDVATSMADLPSVESVPRPRWSTDRLLLAGKGLFLVEPFPIRAVVRPRRFAPDYSASTRCIALAERVNGTPRIFVSHRAGVSELCPDAEIEVARWPLGAASRYAVNGLQVLEDGRLLATHSEAGLLVWEAPDKAPAAPSWHIASARNLLPVPTGFVFSEGSRVYRLDALASRVEPVADLGGGSDTTISDLAAAEGHVLAGTIGGEVYHLRLDEPGRRPDPLRPGAKIYSIALLVWEGRVWVAIGVRRRMGLNVVLTQLGGGSPELSLSVPERPYRLVMPRDGHLLSLGERYLCSWDLNASQQATVTSLATIAPLQDLGLLPAAG